VDGDSLLALVRFHAWANDRILTTATDLSDEELRRSATLDHDSAFGTIRHLVDVDWSWREYCIGNDVGDTYVWDHGFELDDLPALHAFCLEEDARMRGYVSSLDNSALNEPIKIGSDLTVPRWLLVAHVVNHGTHHRGQVAGMIRAHGQTPPPLDLIAYYRSLV